MSEEVVFTISPDGVEVGIDAKGFTGGACKDFTRAVLRKLEVVDSGNKPEFFKEAHQNQILRS